MSNIPKDLNKSTPHLQESFCVNFMPIFVNVTPTWVWPPLLWTMSKKLQCRYTGASLTLELQEQSKIEIVKLLKTWVDALYVFAGDATIIWFQLHVVEVLTPLFMLCSHQTLWILFLHFSGKTKLCLLMILCFEDGEYYRVFFLAGPTLKALSVELVPSHKKLTGSAKKVLSV